MSNEHSANDAARDERVIAQVYDTVRNIPSGRVMSYGAVGAQCDPPISGYICGRIMNGAHRHVPWWRVVGKNGNLPISKRHPELSSEQREKLESESVEFDDDGRVRMDKYSTR